MKLPPDFYQLLIDNRTLERGEVLVLSKQGTDAFREHCELYQRDSYQHFADEVHGPDIDALIERIDRGMARLNADRCNRTLGWLYHQYVELKLGSRELGVMRRFSHIEFHGCVSRQVDDREAMCCLFHVVGDPGHFKFLSYPRRFARPAEIVG